MKLRNTGLSPLAAAKQKAVERQRKCRQKREREGKGNEFRLKNADRKRKRRKLLDDMEKEEIRQKDAQRRLQKRKKEYLELFNAVGEILFDNLYKAQTKCTCSLAATEHCDYR
jgi:hypothetical protein